MFSEIFSETYTFSIRLTSNYCEGCIFICGSLTVSNALPDLVIAQAAKSRHARGLRDRGRPGGLPCAQRSIYDTSRAGINIGDGTRGGHLIERVDVFDTVLEPHDHGSFNARGRDRYWVRKKDSGAETVYRKTVSRQRLRRFKSRTAFA